MSFKSKCPLNKWGYIYSIFRLRQTKKYGKKIGACLKALALSMLSIDDLICTSFKACVVEAILDFFEGYTHKHSSDVMQQCFDETYNLVQQFSFPQVWKKLFKDMLVLLEKISAKWKDAVGGMSAKFKKLWIYLWNLFSKKKLSEKILEILR